MNTSPRTVGVLFLAAACLSAPAFARSDRHCYGSGLYGGYPQGYAPVIVYQQPRLPFYGYGGGHGGYPGYGRVGYGGYAYPGAGYGPRAGYRLDYRAGHRH